MPCKKISIQVSVPRTLPTLGDRIESNYSTTGGSFEEQMEIGQFTKRTRTRQEVEEICLQQNRNRRGIGMDFRLLLVLK